MMHTDKNYLQLWVEWNNLKKLAADLNVIFGSGHYDEIVGIYGKTPIKSLKLRSIIDYQLENTRIQGNLIVDYAIKC